MKTAVCKERVQSCRPAHVSAFDTPQHDRRRHVLLLYTVLDYYHLAGYVESRFFDGAVVVLLITTKRRCTARQSP